MTSIEVEKQADFYRLVCRIMADSPDDPSRNRRQRPRQPYFCTQELAPYYGEESPPPEAFVKVHCYDISTGGFSFFAAELPKFQRLVVRLRTGDASMELLAEVSYATAVYLFSTGDVIPAEDIEHLDELPPELHSPVVSCLVGCRFLRKWRPSELAESPVQSAPGDTSP